MDMMYRALATFLVDQRSYPKSLMDPFKPQEIKIMSKANVIDWKNFTVSRVDKDGIMRMLLSTPESGTPQKCSDKWEYEDAYRQAGTSKHGEFIHIDNIFEAAMCVLVSRINQLRREPNGIRRLHNDTIVKDIYEGVTNEYEPWAFQIDRGVFFPSVKNDPQKFVRPVTAATKAWLKKLRSENKIVFLMTSSNTDYAKCILENIFLDENGKAENYWDYFDLCLADARKPYFFTQQNEFFSVKADYPNDSVKRLIPGLWFLQGNHVVLEEFFTEQLKGTKPKICYFGDSLKSDVVSAKKIAGWSPVYLVEEMLLDKDTKKLLDENDDSYLAPSDESVPYKDAIVYSLAKEYADLITPTIDNISDLPLDHVFESKEYY